MRQRICPTLSQKFDICSSLNKGSLFALKSESHHPHSCFLQSRVFLATEISFGVHNWDADTVWGENMASSIFLSSRWSTWCLACPRIPLAFLIRNSIYRTTPNRDENISINTPITFLTVTGYLYIQETLL